jgi:hypothetical protein
MQVLLAANVVPAQVSIMACCRRSPDMSQTRPFRTATCDSQRAAAISRQQARALVCRPQSHLPQLFHRNFHHPSETMSSNGVEFNSAKRAVAGGAGGPLDQARKTDPASATAERAAGHRFDAPQLTEYI